jgi:hypothetical protein
MKKTIDTLVPDIYELFTGSHEASDELLDEFCENLKGLIKDKLKQACHDSEPMLRMSVIGQPDRKLYFDLHEEKTTENFAEVKNPEKFLKFLFGDMVEQLLIFLIKQSGHTVTHAQEELEHEGVIGHTDGAIDGVPSDIKTASGWAFRNKFATGKIIHGSKEDDSFGYKEQLAIYRDKLLEKYPDEIDPDKAGWLVFNKETGEILWLDIDPLMLPDAESRIKHLKNVVTKDKPPEEKCYYPVPDGKSGNMKLHNICAKFCKHKHKCWEGKLRAFKYSDGVRYLTKVEKCPTVEELTIFSD